MTNDVPITSPNNDRAKNIVQGMGSLTAQNLATALLGLVFQIALVRLISPTQYGVYSGVVVAVGIASTAAAMGLNQAVARYLAFLQRTDEERSWVVARKILYLTLMITVVVAAFYATIAPELSVYFSKSIYWTDAFLLSGLWIFLAPLGLVCQGIVQGIKRYTLLAKMSLVAKVALVLFAIGVLYFYQNIDVAILSWVLYYAIMVIWTLGLTGKRLFEAKGQFSYIELLKYSYPLGVGATITMIASSADLVVVAGYLDPISLGVYNVAVTIPAVLGTIFVIPLITALLPEIAGSAHENEVSNGMRLAFRFLFLGVLPASLLVAAVPDQLIDLFRGGVYLAGSPSLELIAFFYLFSAVQMILVVLFQAVGKTTYAMLVGLVTAASDIGLSILLVPRIGLFGAASAKVSVGLVGALLGIYLGRKYLGGLGGVIFYGKSLMAAAIPFALTYMLSSYVSVRLITLVPYAFVFGILFLLCLKLLKMLTAEDKAFITHLVPKFLHRMIEYL